MTFFGRTLTNNSVRPPPVYPEGFDKKAGSFFFGVDSEYLTKYQKREIFQLVKAGFSIERIEKMSIEERRFYYNLLLEERENSQKDR